MSPRRFATTRPGYWRWLHGGYSDQGNRAPGQLQQRGAWHRRSISFFAGCGSSGRTLCVTGRENNWAYADAKLNDDCAKAKNGVVFPVRVHVVVMAFFPCIAAQFLDLSFGFLLLYIPSFRIDKYSYHFCFQ